MSTATPTEEWALGPDIDLDERGTVQVNIHPHRNPNKVYIDFEHEDVIWHYLSPDQARALATLLLYAADKVEGKV